jgi:hypothetical protein
MDGDDPQCFPAVRLKSDEFGHKILAYVLTAYDCVNLERCIWGNFPEQSEYRSNPLVIELCPSVVPPANLNVLVMIKTDAKPNSARTGAAPQIVIVAKNGIAISQPSNPPAWLSASTPSVGWG